MSTVWDVCTEGGTKEQLLDAIREEDMQPSEVVAAMACSDRLDLLEAFQDDPVYGEEATKELRFKRWLAESHRIFEEKCAKYPPVFQRWRRILKTSKLVGYFDVCYPSAHAQEHGHDDYVAISGDGLLDFLMEVVSLEGDGQFRLARRFVKPEYQTDTVVLFQTAAGCTYGAVLTGTQVANALAEAFSATLVE